MLIPITIGYDCDKKIIDDLVDLVHLLVYISKEQMDVIELNEAFAVQSLAVMRELGLHDEDERVNPNGGAIALGHPLGMSGTRLVITAMKELKRRKGKYALCTMCVGVGQGVALILKNMD